MNKPDSTQSQSTSLSIVATPRQTTGMSVTPETPVVYPQHPVYQYPTYPYPQYPQYYEQTQQYIQPTPQYIQPTPQYIQPTPQYIQPTPQYIQPTPQYIQPTPQYIQPTPQYIQQTPQYTTEQYQCPQYTYYQYPQYPCYPDGYYCEIQYVAPLIISSKSNSSHSSPVASSQPPQDTRETLEVSM